MAPPDPDTADGVVAILAKHAHWGEGVVAQLLQPLEHAAHQVARHEDLGQILLEPGMAKQTKKWLDIFVQLGVLTLDKGKKPLWIKKIISMADIV